MWFSPSAGNILLRFIKTRGREKVKESQGEKDLAGIHSRPAGAQERFTSRGRRKRTIFECS